MDVRLKETYELSILGNNPAQTATTNQHTKHEYLVFTVCPSLRFQKPCMQQINGLTELKKKCFRRINELKLFITGREKIFSICQKTYKIS
jgi:hypothetical protein